MMFSFFLLWVFVYFINQMAIASIPKVPITFKWQPLWLYIILKIKETIIDFTNVKV